MSKFEYNLDKLYNCSTNPKNHYEIDEEMIPIIYNLNSKGYKTTACCQGHIEKCFNDNSCSIYILFKENYDFKVKPPCYKSKSSKTDKSSQIKRWINHYILKNSVGLYYFTSKTDNKRLKEIQRKEMINDLYNWTLKL